MSRSRKARYGTNTATWKDTVRASRVHARARAGWKRLSSRSLRRKDQQEEGRERSGVRVLLGRAAKDRRRGAPAKENP